MARGPPGKEHRDGGWEHEARWMVGRQRPLPRDRPPRGGPGAAGRGAGRGGIRLPAPGLRGPRWIRGGLARDGLDGGDPGQPGPVPRRSGPPAGPGREPLHHRRRHLPGGTGRAADLRDRDPALHARGGRRGAGRHRVPRDQPWRDPGGDRRVPRALEPPRRSPSPVRVRRRGDDRLDRDRRRGRTPRRAGRPRRCAPAGPARSLQRAAGHRARAVARGDGGPAARHRGAQDRDLRAPG